MARKRKPLVLNDVIVELDAPGLQIVKRPNGELWQHWVVSHEGRRRGYLPRTIRLHYDLTTATGRLELEHHCKILTNEMLVWLGDPEGEKKPLYDGTVAALIRCYQTDKNSPYKGLRQNTGRVYADWCRTLEVTGSPPLLLGSLSRCSRRCRSAALSLEHACTAWGCYRGAAGWCCLGGYCGACAAFGPEYDAKALHCTLG
jgi:hypothetical protein